MALIAADYSLHCTHTTCIAIKAQYTISKTKDTDKECMGYRGRLFHCIAINIHLSHIQGNWLILR